MLSYRALTLSCLMRDLSMMDNFLLSGWRSVKEGLEMLYFFVFDLYFISSKTSFNSLTDRSYNLMSKGFLESVDNLTAGGYDNFFFSVLTINR